MYWTELHIYTIVESCIIYAIHNNAGPNLIVDITQYTFAN